MRFIIAGGGTGGHFYPAYVISKEIEKKGSEVVFIIKKNDISIDILKNEDIPFVELDMVALPRGINPFRYLLFIYKLLKSLVLSLRIMEDYRPYAVLGTGSYVAFPLILAARIKGIKSFIHESNAIFGIGNRIAGIFCNKVFSGVEIKRNPFVDKTIITGTPVREGFCKEMDMNEIKKRFNIKTSSRVISVFGGSQGAKSINHAIYYFILKNKTEGLGYTIIHITGKKNFKEVEEKYRVYELLDENLKVIDYYENMEEIYSISDLVISRSGASTISELITLKKPAILIPLKHSALNHQYENAMVLFKSGSAIILKDDEELVNNLSKTIIYLFSQNRLEVMKKGYNHLKIPSGKKVVEIIINEMIKD